MRARTFSGLQMSSGPGARKFQRAPRNALENKASEHATVTLKQAVRHTDRWRL